MTTGQIGQLIIYAGELAGALAMLGVVARFLIVNPLKKWLREQIKAPMDQVHAEITPNHGSSLADAIRRTETAVDEVRAGLVDHITRHPGPTPS